MGTIDDIAFKVAVAVAAACGAAAGRAFALEGENRRTSILAAAYCGAGAGLLIASLFAFIVVLVATTLEPRGGLATDLASAGGAIGAALIWGAASGAGGGLVVGIVVAIFKRYSPAPR